MTPPEIGSGEFLTRYGRTLGRIDRVTEDLYAVYTSDRAGHPEVALVKGYPAARAYALRFYPAALAEEGEE